MLEIGLQLLLKELIGYTKIRSKLNANANVNEINYMISMDVMVGQYKQRAIVQKMIEDICSCQQIKMLKISMNKTLILLNNSVLLESINQISIISSYQSGFNTNKENLDVNCMGNSKRTNKNKNKMVNLDCLSRLCMYCQQNGIDFKEIIKMLLIRQINQSGKMIFYRTQLEIVQFIEDILLYIAKRQQFSILITLIEDNSQQIAEDSRKINVKGVQSFIKMLKYQKQQNYQENISYHLKKNKVQSRQSTNILKQLKKSIGQNQMRRFFIFYYDQLTHNGRISKEIKYSMKISSFFKTLGMYFKKINQQLVKQKYQNTLQMYLCGFYEHRQFLTLNRYKNTKTINNYLISFSKNNSTNSRKYIKTTEKYLQPFIKSINFSKQLSQNRIINLQSNIRAYLSRSLVQKKLEDEYKKTNILKYNENKRIYAKIVQDINKKLLLKNGHVSNGIFCHIFLVHIQNWANSCIFGPQQLLNFINPILQTNVSIVKIWIEDMELKIIRGDGKLFTYGLMNNSSKETHMNKKQYKNVIQSDDLTYQLMKDASGFLFSKGQNNYGQLGIGQLVENTDNWKRVRIKEKVKIYDGRAKRGICVTITEQIYIWGYVSQKQVLFTPKLIKKQSNYSKQQIKSACCSYNGFYIMTSKGQVFNVITGTLIKRLFKQNQNYDQKILMSVGNNVLEIMYGVGLKISCYDTVKKKQLIRWFKKMYELQDSSQGQLLVNQDKNSQWETKKSVY